MPRFLLYTGATASELPTWLVLIIFLVPLLGGLSLYIYKTRHARSWRKGIFPISLKPTEDNFLEAYLALGAKLMLFDYQDTKGKTQYINLYFNQYFTKANYNFGDSLLFSLRYPIKTKTITDWMLMHLKNEASRSQVIYFLVGLALVTGKLHGRELQFLRQINNDLELNEASLNRIIAIYQSYNQHKKTVNSNPKKESSKRIYFEILGLMEGASVDEIKKAYRKLAKTHHPDTFATSAESQQKMAAEKFMEIQRAYEALLNSI